MTPVPPSGPPPGAGMVEYKVVSQRDKVLSGSFDLDALEKTLNTYAVEGWRLSQSLLASSIWKSAKSQIVMVLERPLGGSGESRR